MVAAAALVVACGGGQDSPLPTGPSAITATVRIEHFGVPEAFAELGASGAACASGVGRTYVRASWRANRSYVMTADAGDPHHWVIEFDDVPIGRRVTLQLHDPLACGENASGEVTRLSILVNGVPLSYRHEASNRRGYSFTVGVGGALRR